MLLIIPSITIKGGRCINAIKYPPPSNESVIYEMPEERARLRRKENAKALHLIFEDEPAWHPQTLELIERIRQSVDIPIVVTLSILPDNLSQLKQIIESGIYRLILPHEADDYFLNDCIQDFSREKIVVSIPIEHASHELLLRLKNDGLTRICIVLPEHERVLPIVKLQEIAILAKENAMRLSLMFGVNSYSDLRKISELDPGFDSVILGRALDENSFPCQGIWREMEERAFLNGGAEANLWKNPLENVPHV